MSWSVMGRWVVGRPDCGLRIADCGIPAPRSLSAHGRWDSWRRIHPSSFILAVRRIAAAIAVCLPEGDGGDREASRFELLEDPAREVLRGSRERNEVVEVGVIRQKLAEH